MDVYSMGSVGHAVRPRLSELLLLIITEELTLLGPRLGVFPNHVGEICCHTCHGSLFRF
jgi:hypothetical protein